MLIRFSRQRVQISLVLLVFLGFLANSAGLFEIILDVGGQFRPERLPKLFLDNAGNLVIPDVVMTPEFVVLVFVGIVLSVALPVLTPIQASALTFCCSLPSVYLGFTTAVSRPLVPLEYSLLTILMLFVVNVLLSYFTETHKKQKLIKVFGRYVPPEVVEVISRDPELYSMQGEARELTVMFCDVHSFTRISEELGPEQLASLLNTLFTPLTEIVYRHHGTIDKYIGDALMAFWGAPVAHPDHARQAVTAAFEMQQALTELAPVFQRKGWPVITMGIGINTGPVVVGNMGSEYRMAYTVIGDAVNLASRIQDLTGVYKRSIIVGEATRQAVPELYYRELDLVQVKGKNLTTRIYEPLGATEDMGSARLERLERHQEALGHYHRREWDRAEAIYQTLHQEQPDEYLFVLYLERIANFRANPPPEDWRGEVHYKEK